MMNMLNAKEDGLHEQKTTASVTTDSCCDIQMVGLEFGVNNM